MGRLLHDSGVYDSIKGRVESLRVDSPRRWGRMTIDQMLWHVNVSLSEAAGEYKPPPMRTPLPRPVMRWVILNAPWGRDATTRPDMRVVSQHDFVEQKTHCLRLLNLVAAKSLESDWPDSASMGRMTGKHWSRLQARHLDHHLKQFGA